MNTISWASPTTPLPMEINPRTAFERLFGDGGSAEQRRAQILEDKSILDAILSESRTLHARLGANDRVKLGNYLDNVREIERRIQQIEAKNSDDVTLVAKPLSTPESFEEHTALMFDLLVMAYQADLTRVFTFMMSREASQRTFPQIGVPDPWHVVSHHGEQPEKIARNAKVNVLCLQLFAGFLEKLRAIPNGDGTMLDQSLIFYGSGMGNPNVHATDPLPMIAVGGAGGRGNRHVVLSKKTEIGNLWLSVANQFGGSMDKFGESTGTAEFF
jgi:hypothetical protein